jgi:hypothetical protein
VHLPLEGRFQDLGRFDPSMIPLKAALLHPTVGDPRRVTSRGFLPAPVTALDRFARLPSLAKEGPDVVDQQLRFLHRGEVPSTRHFRVSNHVVSGLD